MERIAALITCHNRKAKTIACLDALFRNSLPDDYSLEVFLVDDASKDGTGKLVKQVFPSVHVIEGDGNLYWNGGMRVAFSAAMESGFDYYLWLNDDTTLYPDTLFVMLNTAKSVMEKKGKAAIVVGTTQTQKGGSATYGGLINVSRWKPLRFSLVPTSAVPAICDTMNGNCVLIPSNIANKVGNLDKAFAHAMGDIDYGLRARKAGFLIMLMSNYAGICVRNSLANTHTDTSLTRMERWRKIISNKELPIKSWFVLTRRHAGLLWPILLVWPYVKVLLGRGK